MLAKKGVDVNPPSQINLSTVSAPALSTSILAAPSLAPSSSGFAAPGAQQQPIATVTAFGGVIRPFAYIADHTVYGISPEISSTAGIPSLQGGPVSAGGGIALSDSNLTVDAYLSKQHDLMILAGIEEAKKLVI